MDKKIFPLLQPRQPCFSYLIAAAFYDFSHKCLVLWASSCLFAQRCHTNAYQRKCLEDARRVQQIQITQTTLQPGLESEKCADFGWGAQMIPIKSQFAQSGATNAHTYTRSPAEEKSSLVLVWDVCFCPFFLFLRACRDKSFAASLFVCGWKPFFFLSSPQL